MDASAAATPQVKKTTPSETGVHSASALTIGVKLKEFVVTGIIGEGGFGIVYSAKDTQLQRNVAIKEYMPAAIANRLASSKINLRSVRHQQTFAAGMQGFIDEARLLAQFKHPALVEILRFWEDNGTAYMVMPHYSGKTLRNILKTSRNVCSERWLKSILGPVLDAIELLHSNHVYHRDIAPDNIVIQDTGQPVLLDLGSARRVIAGMQSALTVVVKPGYAPIEQYTEDTANEQGPWTDIYALGAVLYFAINGSAPTASVSRMMRDSLKPLSTDDYPHYSERFLSSINKALQLRPCDRFQSIKDFRDALNIDVSLTGNITLATLNPDTAAQQEAHASTQHQDEEITLILSEDEISVFKEKLLQSLKSSTNTAPIDKNFNGNILSNESSAKKELPASSFADVKDLLENKTNIASNIYTAKSAAAHKTIKSVNTNQQESAQKQQQNSTDVKRNSVKLTIAIGFFVLTSIILATVFITTSNNESDVNKSTDSQQTIVNAKDDSYKTKESDTPTDLQENTYTPPIIPENVQPSAGSNAQLGTASPLFVEASTNTIEPPAATEQINVTTEQKPAELETTEANQTISKPQDDNLTHNTQTQNTATKKAKTTTTSEMNTMEIAPQTIEMGSAKLTLVPWGEIWINNQRFGVSPPLREVLLAPGTYTIELRNPGMPTEMRTINFSRGANPAIYHDFSAPKPAAEAASTHSNKKENLTESKAEKTKPNSNSRPQKESVTPTTEPVPQAKPAITSERLLSFKVLPWGEIFLDGKMMGVTPPLHELKLAPGEHTIEIRHPSYTTKIIRISDEDPATEKIEHRFQ